MFSCAALIPSSDKNELSPFTFIKEYDKYNKKITDVIGIRVTLYFPDDVLLIENKLKRHKMFDHISKDKFSIEEFKPVRCNLVFNIPDDYTRDLNPTNNKHSGFIDSKYEIQLRTVLSEGWHEVEHDLRYKCKEDWENHDDLNRNLNGIYATLETSEFSMLQLFNVLTYRHYKDGKIESMIKNHFRIKFSDGKLDVELEKYLSERKSILKDIYKIPRSKVIDYLINESLSIPLTINNLIYLINSLFIKDEGIEKIAGDFIMNELKKIDLIEK